MSTPSLARPGSVLPPLAFIGGGVLSLFITGILLIRNPDLLATYHYNQRIISVTHLFVLGWVCSVVFGSLYQLVPVALEVKLHNDKLPHLHFVLHITGMAGMVSMFWVWNTLAAGFYGLVVGAGVVLFLYNLGRTLRGVEQWNVVAIGIASALGWLGLTIAAGLFLAASKHWGIGSFEPIRQMHAHAHLGVLGFLVILIVSVSYKLIPMFILSEIRNSRRALASVWVLNAATMGLAVTILTGAGVKLVFAGFAIAGLALYGCELAAIVRARKRRALDWGVKYFLTGVALLIPAGILALPLSWQGLPLKHTTGQMENLYGVIALMGVVSFALVGMLYKIVPFLVWYKRYSREIGRCKVPALAELYSARLQLAGYWLLLAGLALLCLATALGHSHCVKVGGTIWSAGVAVFAANMVKICLHLLPGERAPASAIPIAGGAR